MARIIIAQRSVLLRRTREVFRIEAEVAAGAVTSMSAHCVFRVRDDSDAILGQDLGFVTFTKQAADLPSPLLTLLGNLVNRCGRDDLFRMQIEIGDDGSLIFLGHCTADPSPVAPGLTAAQTTNIGTLIALIDGET